jgi:hypothetical protein
VRRGREVGALGQEELVGAARLLPLVLVLAVGARRVGHARVAAVGVGVPLLLLVVAVREDDCDGEGDDEVCEHENDEAGDGVVTVEVWLPFAFGGALAEGAVQGGCEGEGDD